MFLIFSPSIPFVIELTWCHFSGIFSGIHLDSPHYFQGNCAENTAKKYSIGREEQDEYAVRSYKLSQKAASEGIFKKEMVPVEIPKKKGQLEWSLVVRFLFSSQFSISF